MGDLNELADTDTGWEFHYAKDINDKGQIVGFGAYEGQAHVFLLTPIS